MNIEQSLLFSMIKTVLVSSCVTFLNGREPTVRLLEKWTEDLNDNDPIPPILINIIDIHSKIQWDYYIHIFLEDLMNKVHIQDPMIISILSNIHPINNYIK